MDGTLYQLGPSDIECTIPERCHTVPLADFHGIHFLTRCKTWQGACRGFVSAAQSARVILPENSRQCRY